ncbi:unnamed protein product [Camellia sinensis]
MKKIWKPSKETLARELIQELNKTFNSQARLPLRMLVALHSSSILLIGCLPALAVLHLFLQLEVMHCGKKTTGDILLEASVQSVLVPNPKMGIISQNVMASSAFPVYYSSQNGFAGAIRLLLLGFLQ